MAEWNDHLDPVQIPSTPYRYQSYRKNEDEDKHLDKGDESNLLEDHRPREEQDYLHVKDEEDQCNNIEPDIELDPGDPLRNLTALIGRVLDITFSEGCNQPLHQEEDQDNCDGKYYEN